MKFSQPEASFLVPDGRPAEAALARTTHVAVGAHQDDIEFMALHGVLACFGREDRGFGGITCTDGGGSPRAGRYAAVTDETMRRIRREEQDAAARVGRYSFMAQLCHPSRAVKDPARAALVGDLSALFAAMRPAVVYTHNPADRHDTHVAVALAVLAALRALPADARPRQVLGCEVWRDLDWAEDGDRVVLDVSDSEHLAAALNGVFDSQIAGGKRYDLAVLGRRRANATFLASHGTDTLQQAWYALDLTPLVGQEPVAVQAFVQGCIDRFAADTRERLARMLG